MKEIAGMSVTPRSVAWHPLSITLAVLLGAGMAQAGDEVRYNRDIRPILNENCFACHGADSAARKAKLRLDIRDEAIKAGAIVPGKPDDSELVTRIFSTDPSKVMPSVKSHKTLTTAQKETLRRWIAEGAVYQPHWSFIAPTRPPVPTVKNPAWVRNPIDAFVLAELEKNGLTPAAEADRRTLARRVSLDLTGLPPSIADVDAFVNDSSPDAYEHFVDKMLASPHWGEHRARYWLDAARYADTHGIHIDNYREIWPYRDWVINAYNRNLPFDQFTIEQLAGDLLPNRTLDQQVASGFNRCNITTSEGGAINEEYIVLYARDRTETTSQVFLGLTTGCAVCHNHKFDPITQKDFYSLSAFFNNTTQAAMDGNIKDTPPTVMVPRMEDRARWQALEKEMAEVQQQADARRKAARPNFDKWVAQGRPDRILATVPHTGLRFQALLAEGAGNHVVVMEDGQQRAVRLNKAEWAPGHVSDQAYKIAPDSLIESAAVGDFDRNQSYAVSVWIKLANANVNGAIVSRMDDRPEGFYRGWDLWLDGGRPAAHLIHKWQEDAIKVSTKNPLKPGQWHHLALVYDGSGKAAGLRLYVDGVAQETTAQPDALKGTTRTDVPLRIGQRYTGSRIDGQTIQDVRVYDRALTLAEINQLRLGTRATHLVAKAPRSPAETEELFAWWLPVNDAPAQKLAEQLATLQQEQATIRSRGAVTHVMQERDGVPTAYILFRGDYDKRRDQVGAATPGALPPMPPDLPRNRLGLAQWLLRPDHPLTARVTVNRSWQELFGTGLVRTAGDFGSTGELPSHPELLDWLAVEFRESGWDVKKFYKMMVMSATYRQAAVVTPEKREKDPQNRLLSRGPRFRMDAEMLRDQALAVSGLLVPKLGGPSVKPYQPDGVWEAVAMIGSNTRDYRRDTGESLYRRGLYTFWKRSAPPASLDILNAPSREFCTVRRERTNTPLQALVTLNDVQYVEAARHLAELTLKEGGKDTDAQLSYLARRLLCRPFHSEEQPIVRASLDGLLAHYKGHVEDAKKLIAVGESKADATLDPATLAAWTMLANELMNLDEVLNK
jgi:mono/diheme cytochrome c family protein